MIQTKHQLVVDIDIVHFSEIKIWPPNSAVDGLVKWKSTFIREFTKDFIA